MKKMIVVLTALLSFAVLAETNQWRTPDTDNLVYMQTEQGLVIIELAPFIAPKHVQRFKNLVSEGFYDGLSFYRVIDGFVAQGGLGDNDKKTKHGGELQAEFTRKLTPNSAFIQVQSPAFKAPETGYLHGFSTGRDLKTKEEWLLHCPGTLAMARGADANSGTTEFYFVIGQATRHLDRNMSSFGRVLYGMPTLQKLNRTQTNGLSDFTNNTPVPSKILWAKMAKDVPAKQLKKLEVQLGNSEAAQKRLESARKLDNPFYHFRGNHNIDLCYHQLRVRLAKPAE